MSADPAFRVGNVAVHGDVILAPMARVSDVPYRAVCAAFGSAMQYTEFVPAEALQGDWNPMWRRLDTRPDEYPIVFQIFGHDAQQILRGAQRVESLGPHIIDINMGCSVPKISERGAGVGMMPRPELVADTFRLLTTHLSVPVTGKLRLGWDDDQRNFLEIARIMEDNGAALIALHGRTRAQKYNFTADWDAIARLKQVVGVPVIGNGDVVCAADIDRMRAHTGCDAVMVGRAAVGNPWIFARRDKTAVAPAELVATIRHHLRESIAYYGEQDGLKLFHRHLRGYLSGLHVKRFLKRLIRTRDPAEFDAILRELEQELAGGAKG